MTTAKYNLFIQIVRNFLFYPVFAFPKRSWTSIEKVALPGTPAPAGPYYGDKAGRCKKVLSWPTSGDKRTRCRWDLVRSWARKGGWKQLFLLGRRRWQAAGLTFTTHSPWAPHSEGTSGCCTATLEGGPPSEALWETPAPSTRWCPSRLPHHSTQRVPQPHHPASTHAPAGWPSPVCHGMTIVTRQRRLEAATSPPCATRNFTQWVRRKHGSLPFA